MSRAESAVGGRVAVTKHVQSHSKLSRRPVVEAQYVRPGTGESSSGSGSSLYVCVREVSPQGQVVSRSRWRKSRRLHGTEVLSLPLKGGYTRRPSVHRDIGSGPSDSWRLMLRSVGGMVSQAEEGTGEG